MDNAPGRMGEQLQNLKPKATDFGAASPGEHMLFVFGVLFIILGAVGAVSGLLYDSAETRVSAVLEEAMRDGDAARHAAYIVDSFDVYVAENRTARIESAISQTLPYVADPAAVAENILQVIYDNADPAQIEFILRMAALGRDVSETMPAIMPLFNAEQIEANINRALAPNIEVVDGVHFLIVVEGPRTGRYPFDSRCAAEDDALRRATEAILAVTGITTVEAILNNMGIHGAAVTSGGFAFAVLILMNLCIIAFGCIGIVWRDRKKLAVLPLTLGSVALLMNVFGIFLFDAFSVGAVALCFVPMLFIRGSFNNNTSYIQIRYSSLVRYAILIGVGLVLIYPLLWMIGSSFKIDNLDIFGNLDILPAPGRATTEHFPDAWQLTTRNTMSFYYLNTLRFLIPRVIGTVISCTITAYAIARFNFPGKRIVFILVIVTLLMPDMAFRIPIFMLFRDLRLIDTFASLYVQEFFAVSSFFVFMIVQFMRQIPRELDEAASIDGCGPLRTLIYVLAPVLRPILITVGLLTFMWGMNDFQGPLIFLNSPDTRVLALALRGMIQDYEVTQYGRMFAAAFMALIPTLAIFFTCSKFFVQSVASSGGKE